MPCRPDSARPRTGPVPHGRLAFAAERQGIIPSARQVLSFKVAPVLGAAIAVENIEVMDFEVIVHITGQLHRQVRDLPPGSRTTGFTVAPPSSQG
jgi:hypothetical protein